MAFDLRLSRERTGVVAMRQDSNYKQLDTMKLGRKGGKKKKKKKCHSLNVFCLVLFSVLSFIKGLGAELTTLRLGLLTMTNLTSSCHTKR